MSEVFGKLGVFIDTGERVQCHACGNYYKDLGSHLLRKHGIDGAIYRERYELMRTQKLASIATREKGRDIHADRLRSMQPDALAKMPPREERGAGNKPARKQRTLITQSGEFKEEFERKVRSPEAIERMKAAAFTPEAIEKRAAKIRGVKLSAAVRQAMSISRKGCKFSEAHRKALSEAGLGKKPSAQAIEKNRMAQLGKKLSAEHKSKIAAGLKLYNAKKNEVSE